MAFLSGGREEIPETSESIRPLVTWLVTHSSKMASLLVALDIIWVVLKYFQASQKQMIVVEEEKNALASMSRILAPIAQLRKQRLATFEPFL